MNRETYELPRKTKTSIMSSLRVIPLRSLSVFCRQAARRGAVLAMFGLIVASTCSAAEFIPLGYGASTNLGKNISVSEDGGVVALRSGDNELVRWTREDGANVILDGVLNANVSGDGSTIVTSRIVAREPYFLSWGVKIVGETIEELPRPDGKSYSTADFASFDGSIVVGSAYELNFGGNLVRWSDGEPEDLPMRWSLKGVSQDGSVVVDDFYRWTAETGAVEIPDFQGDGVTAWGVSSDGRWTVGRAGLSAFERRGIRWDAVSGPEGIVPFDQDWGTAALDVTSDGSLVVGRLYDPSFGGSNDPKWIVAGIWTEASGVMEPLQDILVNDYELSDSLDGWHLSGVYDITDDGRFMVGHAFNPDGLDEAFWLDLGPLVPDLLADFNSDGVVDLLDFSILKADFGVSPAAFEQGDANGDDVVDLLDFNILKSEFGMEAAVPEPSSMAITMVGLFLLAAAQRQRRTLRRPAKVWHLFEKDSFARFSPNPVDLSATQKRESTEISRSTPTVRIRSLRCLKPLAGCARHSSLLALLPLLANGNCSAAEFLPLGFDVRPITFSDYMNVSSDGAVVAASTRDRELVRWSREGGLEVLLQDAYSADISGDGRTIVTSRLVSEGPTNLYEALVIRGNDVELLPIDQNVAGSEALLISDDGQVIIGRVRDLSLDSSYVGWAADELFDIPIRIGMTGVSGAGDVVVGSKYRWSISEGLNELEGLGDIGANALGVSSNGQWTVGAAYAPAPWDRVALRWDGLDPPIPMYPPGNGWGNMALDVSAGGEIVVGRLYMPHENPQELEDFIRAGIWSKDTEQMVLLQDLLAQEYGLADALQDWVLTDASAVTNDGRYVVGTARHADGHDEAYLVDLGPLVPDLLADFNKDGVVDLLDFNILKADFGVAPATYWQGDANGDEVVDLFDFNILKSEFGMEAAVPEPSGAALACGAMACLVYWRRRVRS